MDFKAGIYYIGDPCYVIKGELWSKFCDEVIFNDGREFLGFPVYCGSTAYGDGIYTDLGKRQYLVDSGTIGIIPQELLGLKIAENEQKEHDIVYLYKLKGGQLFQFNRDFEVRIDNGTFVFNYLVIVTGNDHEDEEEY